MVQQNVYTRRYYASPYVNTPYSRSRYYHSTPRSYLSREELRQSAELRSHIAKSATPPKRTKKRKPKKRGKKRGGKNTKKRTQGGISPNKCKLW